MLIEEEGVRRTRERLSQADLIDLGGGRIRAAENRRLAIFSPRSQGRKSVIAVNKNDLPPAFPLEELREKIPEAPLISISAIRSSGIENLKDAIRRVASGRKEPNPRVRFFSPTFGTSRPSKKPGKP